MTLLIAFALALLRLTGFIVEPRLDDEEIHAVSGEPSRIVAAAAADRPLTIVTWNIERGAKFDRIADVLATIDADVILLQEADRFCSRSDHRDVARDLAAQLRMNFITAGEFQEIGEGRRGRPCVSGQAILSRTPIDDAAAVRFADQATLKWRLNPAQPRRGGRMALRARTAGVTFYSVHLESGSDEARRANQVRELVEDASTAAAPVIIGGDFNNLGDAGTPMFGPLSANGFANALTVDALDQTVARRPIDWIFAKGAPVLARVLRAPDASDHDPVIARRLLQ